MAFTVVGSGFGLYGYVPALIETFGAPVVLPERYRSKFEQRPELQGYRDAIAWVADSDAALASATGVVIATTPEEQAIVAQDTCRRARLVTVVLEKPIAVTATAAAALIRNLHVARKQYRVGYTLQFTRWAPALSLPARGRASGVRLSWKFMAYHFSHDVQTWKRVHRYGGGVVRFYGIHLLALLASHGYRDLSGSVVSGCSPDEPERWRATFTGPDVPDCQVEIDSRSPTTCFRVDCDVDGSVATLIDLTEPFEQETAPHGGDRRIGVLVRFLESLKSPDDPFYLLYDAANALWLCVDAGTRFVPAPAWDEMSRARA